MASGETPDIFEKARRIAVSGMCAAGAAAVAGSLLQWVKVVRLPELAPDIRFDGAVEAPVVTKPFTGIETLDGWVIFGGGLCLIAAALLLLVRRKGFYGWLGLIASMVTGAVAIADYRSIGDLSSSFARRMQIVGEVRPGIGLTLAAAAALIGLLTSGAGIAATPSRDLIPRG